MGKQETINKDSCIVCAGRQERRKAGMPHRHVMKCDEKEKGLINRILSEQLKEAIRIIETNKDALERLVNAVITSEKKYLTKEEIQELAGGNIRS